VSRVSLVDSRRSLRRWAGTPRMAIPAAGEKLVKMLSRVDELRPKYWEMEGTVDSVEDVPWVRFHREGFSALPEEVDPGCGVLLPTGRGARKREQINFLVNAAGAFLCKQVGGGILVDMCGGCGHVGLVLAALFPQWEVVIADMNPKALAVAAKRASDAGLSNVQTWEGRIDEFDQPFDFCIALHACGMASDIAIAKAIEARAPVVCAPCCVGKVTSALEVNVNGPIQVPLVDKTCIQLSVAWLTSAGIYVVVPQPFLTT